jgi:PIN domain nuclease of toxin-antitoxin system
LTRWIAEPEKLSREQLRVLRQAVRRSEPLAFCTLSLTEIAVIPAAKLCAPLGDILGAITRENGFHPIPIDCSIAAEIAAIGTSLRDPNDRAIVATARIRRLRLVTADQRIIDSGLVPVVE